MRRWIWYGLLIAGIVFYRTTWRLLFPFVPAIVLAAMLNPAVSWLASRTRLGRSTVTAAIFLLAALFGSGILVLATAALVQGVAGFLESLPTYRDMITQSLERVLSQADAIYLRISPEVLATIQRNIDELFRAGQRLLTGVGQWLLFALGALPGLATVLLISLLAAFFLTKDWAWFMESFRRLLPDEWRSSLDRAGSELGQSLGRYILAQLAMIGISTAVSTLGLLLIGAEKWLAAGLTIGLLDLVPVVGPALLYVPWVIYSWATGHRMMAILLTALYAGVSALRQVIEPRLVGRSLGIHPLIMMAGLYWGTVLLGPKGLLVAPLVLVVTKALITARQESIGAEP